PNDDCKIHKKILDVIDKLIMGIFIILIVAFVLTLGCEQQQQIIDEEVKEVMEEQDITVEKDEGIDIGMTDEAFVAKIVESSLTLKTYTFDMEMVMDMQVEQMGQSQNSKLLSVGQGKFDQENKKAEIIMEMTQDVGFGDQEISSKVYIIGNDQYTFSDMTGWIKTPIEEDLWDQQNQVQNQIDLLKGSEIQIVGEETINGEDTFIVDLTPNIDELADIIQNSQGGDEMVNYDWEDIIRSYDITQWISKETYYPIKSIQKMKMVMTPENLGVGDQLGGQDFEMVTDYEATVTIKETNIDMDIVLPAEAEDAVEYDNLQQFDIE
ncbi:DUF6612 family protein, partial [Nanoarchaeota archaeon]